MRSHGEWRRYDVDVEVHLVPGPTGRWQLEKVVPVFTTSLLLLLAFHEKNGHHYGQHGSLRGRFPADWTGNRCGEGGADVDFLEVWLTPIREHSSLHRTDLHQLLMQVMRIAKVTAAHRKAVLQRSKDKNVTVYKNGRPVTQSPSIPASLRAAIKEVMGTLQNMGGTVGGEKVSVWLQRLDTDQGLIDRLRSEEEECGWP